jgi:hypothetical protein
MSVSSLYINSDIRKKLVLRVAATSHYFAVSLVISVRKCDLIGQLLIATSISV